MTDQEILALYDQELRIQIEYPEARREVTEHVVRYVRKPPGMNFVSFTYAGERGIDRVIDEQLDYFLPLNQPFTWKVFEHDHRPDLESALAARGFVRDDEYPGVVMVLDVNETPTPLLQPVTADIRPIRDAAGLKDVIYVLDKVYGNNNGWVNDRLGGHLKIPGYLSVYVAHINNQPVSVAWTYFPGKQFATLFAGSTIEEYRRQGLYTSLLAIRLQEIQERGSQFAIVDAGAMSRPIVEKHGFRRLTVQYDYGWYDHG